MRTTVALIACAALVAVGRAQTPQQPTFRAGTTVVPLNVTVIDKNGKPITDLTAADFTIYEDKVPQKLSVFATQVLAPEPPDPSQPTSLVRGAKPPAPADTVTPQHRRMFLLMFGYGRPQEPSKAIDATIAFVRERLLPQDMVAVMLFDRVTDLTTDHEYVARVVENFRKRNEQIVSDIDTFTCNRHTCVSNPLDQPPELPAAIQSKIDALFEATCAGSEDAASRCRGAQVHNVRDLLFGTKEFDRINHASYPVSWDLLTTRIDRLKAYAGLEYLRYLDDEKRMVEMLPFGWGGSVQDDEKFAARANAARVAIDIIHTGGVAGFGGMAGPPTSIFRSTDMATQRDAPNTPATIASRTPIANQPPTVGVSPRPYSPNAGLTAAFYIWGQASSERIAELTGGDFMGPVFASKLYAHVDETSRFEYVLGYVPTHPITDNAYRKVIVTVNRRGATVRFRHGYQPDANLAPLDLESLLSSIRLDGAGAIDRPSTDIKLTLRAVAPPAGATSVLVDLKIDASRVSLLPAGGGHFTGSLQVQILCGDEKENVVGSIKEKLALDLSEEQHRQALAEGIAYSTRVPVTGQTKYVKAVVYDFGADLLGSATVTIR